MCKTQVRLWHKRFLSGEKETVDRKRSGRPRSKVTDKNIQLVSDLLQQEGKLSLRDICSKTGLKMGVVFRIIRKELKLKRRALKFMPTKLTDAQKENRKEVCDDNIKALCGSEDPEDFLRCVITGDETWINTCEQLTKQQSSVWLPPNAPRPKRLCGFQATRNACSLCSVMQKASS